MRSRSRRCAGRRRGARVAEDDAWVEGRAMLETVEDLELIDPVAVERAAGLSVVSRAGRARVQERADARRSAPARATRVEAMLRSFSQDDRDHMVEDGKISVTCEFCSSTYQSSRRTMFGPMRRRAGRRHKLRQSPSHDARQRALDGRGWLPSSCCGSRASDGAGPRAKLPGAACRCAQASGAGHSRYHERTTATVQLFTSAHRRQRLARAARPDLGADRPQAASAGRMLFASSRAAAASRSRSMATSGCRPASIKIGRSFGFGPSRGAAICASTRT